VKEPRDYVEAAERLKPRAERRQEHRRTTDGCCFMAVCLVGALGVLAGGLLMAWYLL